MSHGVAGLRAALHRRKLMIFVSYLTRGRQGSLLLWDGLFLGGTLVGWAVDVVLGVVVLLDLFVLGIYYFLEEVAKLI